MEIEQVRARRPRHHEMNAGRPNELRTVGVSAAIVLILALSSAWAVVSTAGNEAPTGQFSVTPSRRPAQPPTPSSQSSQPSPPVLRPVVIARIPHDQLAFTQGLEMTDGLIYEGTGLAGRSQLRELDPDTGEVRRAVPLPGRFFGEGITVVGDEIWQQTFRDDVILRWDRATLSLKEQRPIAGEGWGLCYDGTLLIRSDGTEVLTFLDPRTLATVGRTRVLRNGEPVAFLNELECVDGQVYANVWLTDEIYRIDPGSGQVTAVIDASGLLGETVVGPGDVLNGIAAMGDGEFLITGRRWPTMFRVRFAPRDRPTIG